MQLGIIFNKKKLSGKLTKFWTGCYAYHVLWIDEENSKFYDMSLIRRRGQWPHYEDSTAIQKYDFPLVTKEYLEKQLETDESRYGVFDYCLFALRPIYHLFGYSTRNASGVICSEMINNDLWACGYKTPWEPKRAPPSPCDFAKFLSANDTFKLK